MLQNVGVNYRRVEKYDNAGEWVCVKAYMYTGAKVELNGCLGVNVHRYKLQLNDMVSGYI